MKKKKNPIIWLVIFLACLMILAIIYRSIFSMDKAIAFEVNDKSLETRLLIATQGSDFKNELVDRLVDSLRSHPVYIEVRDIDILPEIQVLDWSGIVVIHTWEYAKPPKEVSNFALQNDSLTNVIFFATSGGGSYAIEGIDAISGASNPDKTDGYLNQILDRIRPLILSDSVSQSPIIY